MMNPPGYEILSYEPAFETEVARLRAILTPTRDVEDSRRYLTWKYAENPYLPGGSMAVARHEGRIVGMRGAYGSLWHDGDTVHTVPVLSDLVVEEAHRAHNLPSALLRHLLQTMEDRRHRFVFSLSATPAVALSALKQGFKLVAPIDPISRMQRFTFARFRTLPPQFRRLDRNLARRRLPAPLSAGCEPRPQAMAALVSAIAASAKRWRHVRDEAFFSWRFRHPVADYRFVYCDGADGLDGYLVLAALRGQTWMPTVIADWEGRNLTVKRQLLQAALKLGRFPRMTCWRFGQAAEDGGLLAEMGFVADPTLEGSRALGQSILVRPLSDGPMPERGSMTYRMIFSDAC